MQSNLKAALPSRKYNVQLIQIEERAPYDAMSVYQRGLFGNEKLIK